MDGRRDPHKPPYENLPADLKVVVWAFPRRYPDSGKLWFRYDVWVIAWQQWTGQLLLADAQAAMVAAGCTRGSAARRAGKARIAVRQQIAAGTWTADIPDEGAPWDTNPTPSPIPPPPAAR